MNLHFDKSYWLETLSHNDWYLRIEKELRETFFTIDHRPEVKKYRHKVYELIADLLENHKLYLAFNGPNLDIERKPIDTIIIHHTTEEPDIPLSKLSAIGLIRQYVLNYLDNDERIKGLKGQPIWSGHFKNDEQVFFAYHWLVRPNGDYERLLEDEYIGWHAGEWDINLRSIGIALSGDYEHSIPPIKQIRAASDIIKTHYSDINRKNILGHLEVKESRTCPGDKFLSDWKGTLLNSL